VRTIFAFIEGQPVSAAADYLVLQVGGLGFRIFTPPSKIEELAAQSRVRLHIHMAVREDSITLYGFASEAELTAFRQLISVSGIGPKLGLAVLSAWEVNQLAQILASGDLKALTTVSGIGTKTAQRICLELKDKLKPATADESVGLMTNAEAALTGLGFHANEVRPILRGLARECGSVEELVRLALSRLAGGDR
jgi:Holliday junction DNA helicase RuvA